nr:MAG: L2 protein [Hydrurga leptonyx papillomavirus 1]
MAKTRSRRDTRAHRRRPKRASAEQLYRTCKQAGTCPPDVIPKIEGDTIADQILKYGSTAVYFGGLGIGTGSGTGGRTGYVPLRPSGGGVRGGGARANLGIPLRPPQVVEEVVTINPEGPSIIGSESTVVRAGTEVSVTSDVVGVTSGPDTVTVPDSTGSSIVTTQPGSTPYAPGDIAPETVSVTHTQFGNPAYIGEVSGTGESSFIAHTTIVAGRGGPQGEAIELQTFPQASTPVQQVTRGADFNFYSKYTQQVYVGDPRFLYAPQDLFTYNNPAFDSSLFDASTTISVDPAELPPEAPDPAFYDVYRLHRPAFTAPKRAGGRVRLSRIGDRLGSVFTRSGTNVGGRAHFYTDISSIGPEEIEMEPFSVISSTSGESSLVTASGSLRPLEDEIPLSTFTETVYDPEADLGLPTISESVPEESYFLRPTGGGTSLSPPTPLAPQPPGPRPRVIPTHSTVPSDILPPEASDFGGYTVYSDFYYDPSLWRKRKRPLPFLFTDAIVAA